MVKKEALAPYATIVTKFVAGKEAWAVAYLHIYPGLTKSCPHHPRH